MHQDNSQQQFVEWFRNSSPYIRAFRGRTFVIAFGGEMLADAQFRELVHDLVLLNTLGIRLVLVHGARPQIEARLQQQNIELHYAAGLRITDEAALECVKQAAGSVRVEIEALLSMGLSNSPMGRADIHVVSGNFVTAQPVGVRDGIDYLHTGEVRRIDTESIHEHLRHNNIILLSPMGYSPTGEIFNLSAEDVASSTAMQLRADKLIFLSNETGIPDNNHGIVRELTDKQVQQLLNDEPAMNPVLYSTLQHAVQACRAGVNRVHLLDRHIDGGILLELFTRDGIGSLISADNFEDIRTATIEDIGGILDLIRPLEENGSLVRRSRELLEIEIEHFTIVERDGLIVACAALYPYTEDKMAELACLAVHVDYQKQGRGDTLLNYICKQAAVHSIEKIFVLTTRTSHWFRERNFIAADIEALPMKKRELYNYNRQSKVFIKEL